MRNRILLPMHIWSVTSKHHRTSARTAAADCPHLHRSRLFVTVNDAVALIVFNSECKRMSSCVFLLSIKAVREKKCQSALFIHAWSKARCWIFLQMRCYGDKYLSETLSTATMMSQDLARGVMRGFLLSSLCCNIRFKPFRRLSSNEAGLIILILF